MEAEYLSKLIEVGADPEQAKKLLDMYLNQHPRRDSISAQDRLDTMLRMAQLHEIDGLLKHYYHKRRDVDWNVYEATGEIVYITRKTDSS